MCWLLLPAAFAAACSRGCVGEDEPAEPSQGAMNEAREIAQADHHRFEDWPAYGHSLPVPDTVQIHRLRGQRSGLASLSAHDKDAALETVIGEIEHLLDRLDWQVTDSSALESGGDLARQWRASHPDVPAIHLTAEPLSKDSGAKIQLEWELDEP